jgi:hypothetical protein
MAVTMKITSFWDAKLETVYKLIDILKEGCFLAYSLTLKMEAPYSSETLLNFYQTTCKHPADGNLKKFSDYSMGIKQILLIYRSKNLKD